jgi:uncharacterized protein (DUF885 family)
VSRGRNFRHVSPLCGVLALLLSIMSPPNTSAAPADDLARLCDDYWQEYLRLNPTSATSLGDHRYDDRLESIEPADREREMGWLESVLDRATNIDPAELGAGERLTRSALIVELRSRLDLLECGLAEWVVDPLYGPQVEFVNLPDITRMESAGDAAHYLRRCRAMGPYLDAHVSNLRIGLASGRVAPRAAVDKAIAQLERLDAETPPQSGLLRAFDESPIRDRLEPQRTELTTVVRDVIRPAFRRYLDFLKTDVKPVARPDEAAGMKSLPGGDDCYRRLIRLHTSLDLSPEEIHAIGLAGIERFRLDLSEIGGRYLGSTDVAEIQAKLRTTPAMYFGTAEEVESKARDTLARARAALPAWFRTLPRADCEVKVMGMHEAPQSFVGYYRQPAADGSRPGNYVINTYRPDTRTRYEAEALAFHESIPGHHLQIAISQELEGLPEFRKHQGVTAFVEGWALYSERLADEMGLYSGDLDRMGMFSYDAWRSCRLVVDTGLHAMGWSREQAIRYMMENTLLAENNIENEVDRYLTMPGQALAYKLGQIEILKLREEAKARLGSRFDIRAFHEEVLKNGAVALPVLREQIELMK